MQKFYPLFVKMKKCTEHKMHTYDCAYSPLLSMTCYTIFLVRDKSHVGKKVWVLE